MAKIDLVKMDISEILAPFRRLVKGRIDTYEDGPIKMHSHPDGSVHLEDLTAKLLCATMELLVEDLSTQSIKLATIAAFITARGKVVGDDALTEMEDCIKAFTGGQAFDNREQVMEYFQWLLDNKKVEKDPERKKLLTRIVAARASQKD